MATHSKLYWCKGVAGLTSPILYTLHKRTGEGGWPYIVATLSTLPSGSAPEYCMHGL